MFSKRNKITVILRVSNWATDSIWSTGYLSSRYFIIRNVEVLIDDSDRNSVLTPLYFESLRFIQQVPIVSVLRLKSPLVFRVREIGDEGSSEVNTEVETGSYSFHIYGALKI